MAPVDTHTLLLMHTRTFIKRLESIRASPAAVVEEPLFQSRAALSDETD